MRMWGYALVLAAIAFLQAPGRIVADTKFDLAVNPWGFLSRAAHMWDPGAAFGQIQNQAYGYFWPMGPFFLGGHLAQVPAWITQRLWWVMLLCLSFIGVVRLCQRLGVGRPWTQVLAGFAFALSPHLVTLVGATSVEAWPTALAPWVLLPLVKGTRQGSERRAAAISALVIATAGGVNAVAVSAVLPLGALWIFSRARGPRRWRLFWWWVLFTTLATLWWVVPLLLMGSFSPPFLDYIENAVVTTRPTGLGDVILGTSDWVSYIAPAAYPAGHLVATRPFLLLDAAAVAGMGLAGIARRDLPHRRFLLGGVVTGLILVGFGYVGAGDGWWAEARQALLDAGLAPFRNLHKYDVVLRLPLVIGMAHFLAQQLTGVGDRMATLTGNVARGVAVLAMIGLATPWYLGLVAPAGAMTSVPTYWEQAAGFLGRHAADSVSLEVPASAFGDYLWGSPHDDVLQPLARSPWAVRNVVPLAEPGNVVFLDAVTRAAEGGRRNPVLATVLGDNGIGRLVVRNDLNRLVTGAPDPVVLHQALDHSAGLRRVAAFGPLLGSPTRSRSTDGVRVVADQGLAHRYPAVEIYEVTAPVRRVSLWPARRVPELVGDPGTALDQADDLSPVALLAGDAPAGGQRAVILTDGLKNREKAFAAVRENESATLPRDAPQRLAAVVPNHRIYDQHQERWETTESWRGAAGAEASSSQGYADAAPPLDRGEAPGAALDGDATTQWQSARNLDPRGQWLQLVLRHRRAVDQVAVTMGRRAGVVDRLALSGGGKRTVVDAPPPGGTRTYRVGLGPTRRVRVTAVSFVRSQAGPFAVAELSVPGVEPMRVLSLPRPRADSHVTQVSLARDRGVSGCLLVSGSLACHDQLAGNGEDGDWLNRVFTLPSPQTFRLSSTGSVRSGAEALDDLQNRLPVTIDTTESNSRELAGGPLAMVDGNPATTWVSASDVATPSVSVSWPRKVVLHTMRIQVNSAAPAARPTRLTLGWGAHTLSELVGSDGLVGLPDIKTDFLRIDIEAVEPAFSFENGAAAPLPAGISELSFNEGELALSDSDTGRSPVVLGCDAGPSIRVDGTTIRTSVSTTLRELLAGGRLTLSPCDDGGLPLAAGRHLVSVAPTALVRPDTLRLQVAGAAARAAVTLPATPTDWGSTRRAVRLPSRPGQTLLVVAENFNAGWQATMGGRTLATQRVDGWKQGWWVPPGGAATVRLDFVPDALYRWALVTGLVGIAIVGAAALWRGRSSRAGLAAAAGGRWETVALLLAGGLLAGWPGVGVAAVAVLVTLVDRSRRVWAGSFAGLSILLTGLVAAVTRPSVGPTDSALAQLLVVAAVCSAFLGLPANGPLFRRRMKGRSSQ